MARFIFKETSMTSKNDVVISVNGGCVEVESVPDNLRVVVKDYDCLDLNNDGPISRKFIIQRDAFGDRYMQTVHEGGETPQMTGRQKEIIRIALRLLVSNLANIKAEVDYDEFDDSFRTIEEEELHGIIDLLN